MQLSSMTGDQSSVDSFISIYYSLFKIASTQIFFISFFNVFLFVWKAIYTQPGGQKTTTIKNALSELYNMSVTENNQISGIKLYSIF